MKFALVFVLFSARFGAPPERAPEDPWFGRDKLYHFVGSAVIQGAGHALGRAAGLDYREAAWTAAGLTLTVGVAKELHDRADGRFFSTRDLAADALGTGAGAVLARQVDRR
jgi:putative lipoprotein